MKNENGLSFIGMFFAIIFIIFVIAFGVKFFNKKITNEKNADIKSNMLLIKGACKRISDEATVNKNTDNYVGTNLTKYKTPNTQKEENEETSPVAEQNNSTEQTSDGNQKSSAEQTGDEEQKSSAEQTIDRDQKSSAEQTSDGDQKGSTEQASDGEQKSGDGQENSEEDGSDGNSEDQKAESDNGESSSKDLINDKIITEFLEKNILNQNEYDKYYVLNNDDLKKLEIDVENEEDSYYLVNYSTGEVIITSGFNGKYKLSEIE